MPPHQNNVFVIDVLLGYSSFSVQSGRKNTYLEVSNLLYRETAYCFGRMRVFYAPFSCFLGLGIDLALATTTSCRGLLGSVGGRLGTT